MERHQKEVCDSNRTKRPFNSCDVSQSVVLVFCLSVFINWVIFHVADLFSWGSLWISSPPAESTSSKEDSPTHPVSTLTSSSNSLTTESIISSEMHTLSPSSSSHEVTFSSKESWITVELETTTKLPDKREETVTSRASGRGGRGRGKKHRGEDRSREDKRRGEERGKTEEEGSGEITGAEAKGEIQVSRRTGDNSRPRERSRERSRERGHRKGQSTTTTTTTATSLLVTTDITTTRSENDSSTSRDQLILPATENSSLSIPQEPIQTLSSSPSPSPSPSMSSSPSPQTLLESEPSDPFPSHSSTSSSPSYSQIPSLSPSSSPTFSHSPTQTQTTGLAPSPQADIKDYSNDSLTSPPSFTEEKVAVNGSADYPLSLLGPQDDEESAWSHAVGSGTLLPGVADEDSTHGAGGGGDNISTTTVSPTGKHQSDF